MTSRVLPSQARRRALAELDALLARAEQTRATYLALAGRLAAAGGDARVAKAKAQVTEVRAERLRRGREVLVSGDAGGQAGRMVGDVRREHLALAERHIDDTEARVAAQTARIAAIDPNAGDEAVARRHAPPDP